MYIVEILQNSCLIQPKEGQKWISHVIFNIKMAHSCPVLFWVLHSVIIAFKFMVQGQDFREKDRLIRTT